MCDYQPFYKPLNSTVLLLKVIYSMETLKVAITQVATDTAVKISHYTAHQIVSEKNFPLHSTSNSK